VSLELLQGRDGGGRSVERILGFVVDGYELLDPGVQLRETGEADRLIPRWLMIPNQCSAWLSLEAHVRV
jgi:hypothetical protein